MKYLLISPSIKVRNIDHALDILRRSIAEAIYLNRSLVMGTFDIEASGNLGYTLRKVRYDRFVDLNKTRICAINNGNIMPINESLHHISAEDFDIHTYSDDEVLSIKDNKALSSELNDRYKVIIRRITSECIDNYPDILIRFHASSEVEGLTDVVLKAIGTGLDDVKKRSSIHYGVDYSANQDFFQNNTPLHPSYYACLHIPHNDYPITPAYAYASSRRQIKNTFDRLNIRRKTTVYVITDIPIAGNYDFLKKYCKLYRYHDFPELKALISADHGQEINYAMLHLVEKNLLQYADIKMIPFQPLSGLPVIYNNSSHNIPLRYIYSALCRSLIKNCYRANK